MLTLSKDHMHTCSNVNYPQLEEGYPSPSHSKDSPISFHQVQNMLLHETCVCSQYEKCVYSHGKRTGFGYFHFSDKVDFPVDFNIFNFVVLKCPDQSCFNSLLQHFSGHGDLLFSHTLGHSQDTPTTRKVTHVN